MNEIELANLNQIDTECNCCDDDDSFGSIVINSRKDSDEDSEINSYKRDTGVIIDLSDSRPRENLRSTAIKEDPSANTQANAFDALEREYDAYNTIDTETPYYDDTEDEAEMPAETPVGLEDFSGLVDEDMARKRRKIKHSSNVLKQAQKAHASTIKKGAYNNHFHFAGNPAKEADMFNNMTDTSGGPSLSPVGPAVGGMGEALQGKTASRKLLDEMFSVIGFDVLEDSDGTINAFDNCDPNNDIQSNSIADLIDKLSPYISLCIICPLEIRAGRSFENYQDCCDWYRDNASKYPDCAQEVSYCDVLANKLGECGFKS